MQTSRLRRMQRRRRGAVLALPALVATAVGLTACGPSAAGPAGPASAAHAAPAKAAPKPTIVLVHGAWADASSWNGEVDRLQRDGYVVRAIDNPVRGLTSDAADVKDFLSTVMGPIVLVGHSYGGAVITNAAAGNPHVRPGSTPARGRNRPNPE